MATGRSNVHILPSMKVALRDIKRVAIQQWVADNFGKASDGRRMESPLQHSRRLEWEGPLGFEPAGGV
jgi:hypothetical protein